MIIEIQPNNYKLLLSDGKISATFSCHNKYSKRVYFSIRLWWWLLHGIDYLFKSKYLPELNFGFDTLTAYPSAGEVSPCDGYTFRTGQNTTFALIRTGSGNTTSVTGNILALDYFCSSTPNQYAELLRSFVNFDTSSITALKEISSAIVSLYCTAKGTGTKPAAHIVKSNAALSSTITNSDYSSIEFNSFGSRAYDSYVLNQYGDISLNSLGIASINKSGVTQFAILNEYDLNNAPPLWTSGDGSTLYWASADATGTANDPKLTVIYAAPATYKSVSGISSANIKTASGIAKASIKKIIGAV